MNLSIVVPVYNEQLNIDKLIEEIKTNVQNLVSNFEVIIVDDGSSDKTWSRIMDNCRKDERRTESASGQSGQIVCICQHDFSIKESIACSWICCWC